jgi:hypothetical protein
MSHGRPSDEVLSTFPVLRLPQTRSDYAPAGLRDALSFSLSDNVSVYADYIRRVRILDGFSLYLVPVSEARMPPLSSAQANRCYRLAISALNAKLPTLRAADRATTRRYGYRSFEIERYNREASNMTTSRVVLFVEHTGGGFEVDAESTATIRRAGMLASASSSSGALLMYGVVPSGVASVTIRFPAARFAQRRAPAASVRSKVVHGSFVIRVPDARLRGAHPAQAIWRSPSGKILKTINEYGWGS